MVLSQPGDNAEKKILGLFLFSFIKAEALSNIVYGYYGYATSPVWWNAISFPVCEFSFLTRFLCDYAMELVLKSFLVFFLTGATKAGDALRESAKIYIRGSSHDICVTVCIFEPHAIPNKRELIIPDWSG